MLQVPPMYKWLLSVPRMQVSGGIWGDLWKSVELNGLEYVEYKKWYVVDVDQLDWKAYFSAVSL